MKKFILTILFCITAWVIASIFDQQVKEQETNKEINLTYIRQ